MVIGCFCVNLYRIVSTVTRLWAGPVRNHGSFPLYSVLQSVSTGCRTHPAACSMHTRAPFPALEWLGHESDHWPLSCAVVNNEQNYIFTSPVCLRGVQREGFTFFYVCCQSRVEILATLCCSYYNNILLRGTSWQWRSTRKTVCCAVQGGAKGMVRFKKQDMASWYVSFVQ